MFREALAIRRDLYGPRHPLVASTLGQLAGALEPLGRTAEADTMHREAVAILREAYPDGHPLLAVEVVGRQIAVAEMHDDRVAARAFERPRWLLPELRP